MALKEWIVAILLIVGAAIGTAISSGLSETEILKPKVEFKVNFDPNFGNTTVGEKFSLKNIGNEQAKNAILHIKANKPIKISNSICPESSLPNSQSVYHEIKFEKISAAIDCIFEFEALQNKIFTVL